MSAHEALQATDSIFSKLGAVGTTLLFWSVLTLGAIVRCEPVTQDWLVPVLLFGWCVLALAFNAVALLIWNAARPKDDGQSRSTKLPGPDVVAPGPKT